MEILKNSLYFRKEVTFQAQRNKKAHFEKLLIFRENSVDYYKVYLCFNHE